jgi:hypothetical protein
MDIAAWLGELGRERNEQAFREDEPLKAPLRHLVVGTADVGARPRLLIYTLRLATP